MAVSLLASNPATFLSTPPANQFPHSPPNHFPHSHPLIEGLDSLVGLDLSSNNISAISAGTLTKPTYLSLAYNAIGSGRCVVMQK